MKKLVIATAMAAALISGCANAPPNTPGAGYGKNYTPVIDTLGVDKTRYDKDLGDCRQFAGIIDDEKMAMQGMIGGILMGALLGTAIGHNNGMTNYGANYGAVAGGSAGLNAAANRAINQQERILINCMAGRGYRTLDASVAPGTTYPSPYTQSITPQTASNPAQPPQAQVAPVKSTFGKDRHQAERLAEINACTMPVTLGPSGSGFEIYSSRCANGETMMIRCEFGNCRTLK